MDPDVDWPDHVFFDDDETDADEWNDHVDRCAPCVVINEPYSSPAFGVEMELGSGYSIGDELLALRELISPYGMGFKPDGSINGINGIEFFSQPMSLEDQITMWQSLCHPFEGNGLRAEHECGMHVHISADMTDFEKARFILFFHNPVNKDWIFSFAGRNIAEWAGMWHDAPLEQPELALLRDRKYSAAWLHDRYGTIEVRIFSATTDSDLIEERLRTLNRLIAFAKTDHPLTYDAFIQYDSP